MSARAMFRASLAIGDRRVPVRLYAAVEDTRVHFRLLHEPDRVPVSQKMVDPETEEEIDREETRRGLEVEPGRFAMLEPEELEEIRPETTRTLPVEVFVDKSELDAAWLDRPYYLGPDGDDDSYFALAAALGESDKVGLTRWAMRNKRYTGALDVHDGYLVLIKLRHDDQVRLPREIAGPAGSALDDKQVALAEQLVGTLEDDFEPEAFENEYRKLVAELIDKKRKGQRIPAPKRTRRGATDDLAQALRKSLQASKGKRVA